MKEYFEIMREMHYILTLDMFATENRTLNCSEYQVELHMRKDLDSFKYSVIGSIAMT